VPKHRQIQSLRCGEANFRLHLNLIQSCLENPEGLFLAAHQQGIERHKVAAYDRTAAR